MAGIHDKRLFKISTSRDSTGFVWADDAVMAMLWLDVLFSWSEYSRVSYYYFLIHQWDDNITGVGRDDKVKGGRKYVQIIISPTDKGWGMNQPHCASSQIFDSSTLIRRSL